MESVYDHKNNCCGCTACEHICPVGAIAMEPDGEGFLYPVIDQELCIDCGRCVDTCAFQKGWDASGNLPGPEVYAAKHKSGDVRLASTSGGAFTALSDPVLAAGGAVYGAAFEGPEAVVHKRALKGPERDAFRGSKYVQSSLGHAYRQAARDLQEGREVLFSGTPCQTAGLQRFLDKARVERAGLLAVDFICHGTPSPKLYRDYIAFVEKKKGKKVASHTFRSKETGWGHKETTVFTDGTRDASGGLGQAYKVLFYSDLALRPACHNCKYAGTVRPSDVTIADYWGIEKASPGFGDKLGVSAVLVNTPKGRQAFEAASGAMETVPTSLKDCAASQGNLSRPAPMKPGREAFWQEYAEKGFEKILRKHSSYGLKRRLRLEVFNLLARWGLLEKIKRIRR